MIEFLDRVFSLEEWNGTQVLLNTALRNGRWVDSYKVSGFKPLYTNPCVFEHPAIFKYIGDQCLSSNANVGNWYTWEPAEDLLENWDSLKMCLLMNGRTIMFAGDSLQSQFFFSFVSAALASVSINLTTSKLARNLGTCSNLCEWTPHGTCESPVAIDCGDRIPPYYMIFSRTNFLDSYSTSKDSTHWLDLIELLNVSILFINTGAHYQSDDSLIQNINNSLNFIFNLNRSVGVIYRNTFHGHDHCGLFVSAPPLTGGIHHHLIDEQIKNHPDYGWQHFNHQNDMVRDFLWEHFPDVFYLDIASSTNLRIDSHVSNEDCYHYCLPGPVDNWVIFHFTVLYQILGINNSSIISCAGNSCQSQVNNSFARFSLIGGDILIGEPFNFYHDMVHMLSHFIYLDESKRYVAPEDLRFIFLLLNTSHNFVRIIPQIILHSIPTQRWHVTVDHIESHAFR